MNDYIDRLNYANDHRTQGPAKTDFIFEMPDGTEVEIPTCWGVCPVCDGRGKHVNPSIDAGGLSADAFADDPDFRDDYMHGVYDVQCSHCGGRTTVKVPNLDALPAEQRAEYDQQCRDDAEHEAERRAEFIMGC